MTLLDRLQRATEGSRELDAEIWMATQPGVSRKQWSYTHTASGKVCDVDETRDASHRLITVPHYTTNLQDAVSLLKRGWLIEMSRGFDDDGEYWSRVKVANSFLECREDNYEWFEAHGDGDLPLICCEAIIKAHESSKAEAA